MTALEATPFEDVPLLRGLSPEVRRLVAAGFEPVRFAFGEVIVRQGEPADALYVLTSGRARVLATAEDGSEVSLHVLGAGDSLGADGLVRETARTATVRASGEVEAGRLDAAVFRALAAANPEVATQVELAVRRHQLGDFLRVRSEFGDLPAEALDTLLARLARASMPAGAAVIRQGEPPGSLYFVTEGRLRVVCDGRDVGALGPGDHFGERSLFTGEARSADVHAVTACQLLYLPPETFRTLLGTHPEFREKIARRVAQYDYRDRARVSADIGAELLPADAEGRPPVGDDQVDVLATEPAATRSDGGRLGRLRPPRAVPLVRQTAEVGAGAACLTMLGRFHGLAVEPERAARLVAGATGLVAAAQELGMTARYATASGEELDGLPVPMAAGWDTGHWVVVEGVDRAGVRLTDPAVGRRRCSRTEFDRHCAGEFVLVGPAPGPSSEADGRAEVVGEVATAVAGPFATADGRFVKHPGRARKVPLVWQVDEADCGAACLTMVTRFHGRKVGLARVRELGRTGVEGTTLSGLTDGAEALGLAARRVKASRRNLDEMPLPAIAHWDGNHWVVVEGVDERSVRVADPAMGHRRFSRTEFDERWSGYAALFEPTPALAAAETGGVGFGWMWSLLRPYRARMAAALLLALAVAGLQMLVPAALQVAVDRVIPGRDVGLLYLLVAGLGVLIAAVSVGSFGQRYLLAWVAVRMDSGAMDALSSRLLDLPMSYFYARRTGDIQRRFAGMQQIRRMVVGNGVTAITSVTQLAAGLVFMVALSPTLAGLYWASVPVYVVLTRYANNRLRPLTDSLEEAYGRYSSRQVDAVRGIETVKAAAAEDMLRGWLVDEFRALTRRSFRVDLGTMLYEGATRMVTLVSLALFIWVGVSLVLAGNLSIGELVAFNALLGLTNAPVLSLLGMYDQLQLVSVLLGRLSDVFQTEPEQGADRSHLAPVPALAGRVRLRDVGFRYGGTDAPRILEHLSLDVPAGATVAIVGRSGSGKTTLAKLLAGLVEPTEGAIAYDGADMTTLDYRELRRHIGVVLQESYLFADTIAGNVAFGSAEPDPARVQWAAKVANAHEFVARLPLGYQTKIGETGLLLSGGQRQRIAIARAVYDGPSVLILDEATSALDTESERAVQESMGRLLEGRTSFVIAHRLSTVRHADLIVVLEKGRIVEQGTHDELMDREGLYFYLTGQQLNL